MRVRLVAGRHRDVHGMLANHWHGRRHPRRRLGLGPDVCDTIGQPSAKPLNAGTAKGIPNDTKGEGMLLLPAQITGHVALQQRHAAEHQHMATAAWRSGACCAPQCRVLWPPSAHGKRSRLS